MDKYDYENTKIVPMSEDELQEVLKHSRSKKEDVVSAYKKGNTQILINGSTIPKNEYEYQQNIHKLEFALGSAHPGTIFTVTKLI